MADVEGRNLRELIDSEDNALDFLRLLFAGLVAFSHCFINAAGSSMAWIWGDPSLDPIWRLSRGKLFGGTLGVDFFFLISGFLVTRSWFRSRGLLDYLRRRIQRIYPAFIVVCVVCAFFFGPLAASGVEAYFLHFQQGAFWTSVALAQQPVLPEQLLFLDNPRPRVMNGALWTIQYEVVCYLVVALLGLSQLLRVRLIVLLLFLVAFGSRMVQVYVDPGLIPYQQVFLLGVLWHWPDLASFFLAGAVFYLYGDRIRCHRWAFWVCLAVLVLTLPWAINATLPLFGSYAVLYAAFALPSRFFRIGRWGDFSYGVYLYHYPVQQLMLMTLPVLAGRPYWLFLASSPFIAVLAVLSWYGVERRFLRRRKLREPAAVRSA